MSTSHKFQDELVGSYYKGDISKQVVSNLTFDTMVFAVVLSLIYTHNTIPNSPVVVNELVGIQDTAESPYCNPTSLRYTAFSLAGSIVRRRAGIVKSSLYHIC